MRLEHVPDSWSPRRNGKNRSLCQKWWKIGECIQNQGTEWLSILQLLDQYDVTRYQFNNMNLIKFGRINFLSLDSLNFVWLILYFVENVRFWELRNVVLVMEHVILPRKMYHNIVKNRNWKLLNRVWAVVGIRLYGLLIFFVICAFCREILYSNSWIANSNFLSISTFNHISTD